MAPPPRPKQKRYRHPAYLASYLVMEGVTIIPQHGVLWELCFDVPVLRHLLNNLELAAYQQPLSFLPTKW